MVKILLIYSIGLLVFLCAPYGEVPLSSAHTPIEVGQEVLGFKETVENYLDRNYAALLDEARTATGSSVLEHPLSEEERVAIYGYTARYSGAINAALRTGGKDLEHLRTYVDRLNSGLRKLPDYASPQPLFRGTTLPAGLLAQHAVGSVVEYPAYTSTSIARGFPGPHQFKIYSRHGKLIEDFARFSEEREVLFLPHTRFRVLERKSEMGPYGEIISFVLREE